MRGTEGLIRDEQYSRRYLWVPLHSIFCITLSALCNGVVRPLMVSRQGEISLDIQIIEKEREREQED